MGFGKGTASKTLWVDGIDPTMNEGLLERHMTKFGKVHYTRILYMYNNISTPTVAIPVL